MTRRVAITAVDAVTALGDDLATTFTALAEGRTGFGVVDRFDVSLAVNDRGAQRHDGLPVADMVGRLLSRVAAERGPLVVDRAYFAGTPDEPAPELPDVVVRAGPPGSEPGGWDRVYTGACISSSSALIDAAAAVAHGWCNRALVVAARRIDRATFHLFSAGGAMTREPCMRPLTARRSGVLLGDGAAVVLLEGEDVLAGRVPVVEVSGWARTGDGFHPFQPEPDGRGMVRAIDAALAAAELAPGQIGQVSVHGTGTQLSDSAEVAALTTVFGAGKVPATYAPKAAVGHALEAAGLVETAVATRTVVTGVLPPTGGALPDGELLVSTVTTRRERDPNLTHILKMNLAFGGGNTVVVLSRWTGGQTPAPRRRAAAERAAFRLRASVGSRADPPVVAGFMKSGYPPAVVDAADRCLQAADLSADVRARTSVAVLAPHGDAETIAAVHALLDAGRRPPPPLFVQSTPSSIVGRIAKNWRLGGGVNIVSTARELGDPLVVTMVAEMGAADDAAAILVVRHVPPRGDIPSLAEAALYTR